MDSPPRTLPAASFRSRLVFSFRATVHTNQLDEVLGRACQHHFVLFQPWTPRLFPLPTESLKSFIPGRRQKCSTAREEPSSPERLWHARVSSTRASSLQLQVGRVFAVGCLSAMQRSTAFMYLHSSGLCNLGISAKLASGHDSNTLEALTFFSLRPAQAKASMPAAGSNRPNSLLSPKQSLLLRGGRKPALNLVHRGKCKLDFITLAMAKDPCTRASAQGIVGASPGDL